jgi:hypothetical protein
VEQPREVRQRPGEPIQLGHDQGVSVLAAHQLQRLSQARSVLLRAGGLLPHDAHQLPPAGGDLVADRALLRVQTCGLLVSGGSDISDDTDHGDDLADRADSLPSGRQHVDDIGLPRWR